MAKEVVFESERYEKRQSAKRYLLPALGILAVVVIAVAVTLILRGGRKVISGGEDTPYPYVWTANKNGTIRLELDHSASPDYVWRLDSLSRNTPVQREEDPKEHKTVFTLTPDGAGRMMLSFVLERAEDGSDRIYELHFLAETEETKGGLAAAPVSVAGKPLQGKLRGGTDTLEYTVQTDEDGDLAIAVAIPVPEAEEAPEEDSGNGEEAAVEENDSDWSCDSSDESIALPLGVIYGDEAVVAYFRPANVSGAVTLRMFDAVTGVCITAECENDGEGSLRVITHGVTAE